MKPNQGYSIDELIRAEAELTNESAASIPVVLMTRIRLARNLAGFSFPGKADVEARQSIYEKCQETLQGLRQMKDFSAFSMDAMSELEKQVLVERHLISRELAENGPGSGVVINRDQSVAVMVNEEDHLRVQVMASGFNLKKVWKMIDRIDTDLEKQLDYAFSEDLGYLTACPTNVGTGIRASAMMHLPGLVITNNMDKVVRAVNQLGIVVRGLFGEGSDTSGSVFQISNQQTLGESESTIIKRLENVLKTVVDQEEKARSRLMEKKPAVLLDKIGRAYGILQNCRILSSAEAMNLLSLMRLSADMGFFPESLRARVDRLFIEGQPGHIRYHSDRDLEAEERDQLRSDLMRREFSRLSPPDYLKASPDNESNESKKRSN